MRGFNLGIAALVSALVLPGSWAAAAGKPQLVLVPMVTLGTSASEGMEAWTLVKDALRQSRSRLKVSVALQKKRHDFIVGPAREQAKDCAGNVDCLKEIGDALGADILVTGQVTPKAVSLIAVEVGTGRVVGEAETPNELSKAPLGSRASAAARLLVAAMVGEPRSSGPSASGPSSAVPGGGGGPSAMRPSGDPQPASSAGGLKGFDDGPASDSPPEPPRADTTSSPSSEPPPPMSRAEAMKGTLQISASNLSGVKRVAVDGTELSFSGDGSISWRGAPGDHRLVAEKVGGERLSRNIFLEPGSTTNVVLQWPSLTAAPPPPAQQDSGGSVITKWWFWTSIGAAVAAGTTTAVLLAGGDKGGPALSGETGTIEGSY